MQIPEQLYNYRLNLNSITISSKVFHKIIDTIFIDIDLIEHNELRFAKHYISIFFLVIVELLGDNNQLNIKNTSSIVSKKIKND